MLTDAETQTKQALQTLTDADARADAWGQLGMRYHGSHLAFEAETAYGRALTEAESARWRYLRAIARMERGELNLAIDDLRYAVAMDPGSMAAWYRLGVGLSIQGDTSAALAALTEAHKLAPDSAVILVALADVAVTQDEWTTAESLLERARTLSPDAGRILYKLAMIRRHLGDIASARTLLAEWNGNDSLPQIDDPLMLAVAQMSQSAAFFLKAAEWAMAGGDTAAALTSVKSAIEVDPESVDAHLAYAHVLALTGRQSDATDEVRWVLNADPESARGWYLLAFLHRTSSSSVIQAETRAAIQRSLVLKDDEQSRTLAAALAMRAGRYEEAAREYASLIERRPEVAYYHYWLGLATIVRGDCAAEQALAKAVTLQKTWAEAHLALARTEAICGHTDRARQRTAVLLRARDDADTRLTLAFVELSANDRDVATALATPFLPHPDAQLLLNAISRGEKPAIPFAATSNTWLPPEVR